MTAPNPTPIDSNEINELVGEIIHCQKMVDFGGADWAKYGDKLIRLRYTVLPDKLNAMLVRARIDETKRWMPISPDPHNSWDMQFVQAGKNRIAELEAQLTKGENSGDS